MSKTKLNKELISIQNNGKLTSRSTEQIKNHKNEMNISQNFKDNNNPFSESFYQYQDADSSFNENCLKLKNDKDYLLTLKQEYFNLIETNDYTNLFNLLNDTNDKVWEFLDKEGNTGIILACNLDFDEITSTLLKFINEKLSHQDIKTLVNERADNGFTALHYAAYRGNLKNIEILIKNGANPVIKNENGLNVMHLAAQGNQVCVLLYFNLYHEFCYETLDNANSTPLHWASYSGSNEAFDFLVANDVDINSRDKDGSTPLHLAALSEKKKIASKLIKLECDWNIKDLNGRTAQDVCISKGDDDMTQFFKEKTGLENLCEPGRGSTYKLVFAFVILLFLTESFFYLIIFKCKIFFQQLILNLISILTFVLELY